MNGIEVALIGWDSWDVWRWSLMLITLGLVVAILSSLPYKRKTRQNILLIGLTIVVYALLGTFVAANVSSSSWDDSMQVNDMHTRGYSVIEDRGHDGWLVKYDGELHVVKYVQVDGPAWLLVEME